MKGIKMKFIAPVAMAVLLTSCGGATSSSTTSSDASSMSGALLGALAQGVMSNGSQTNQTINSAVNTGSVISGLIGQLTNSTSTASSIVGKWSYSEPTIQFESENLLAKAGGTLASQSIIAKVLPYYQKIGITKGALSFVFNKDSTCSYTIKGKSYQGTYVYDNKTNSLSITNSLGINILNAYATVSSSDMALTFDTSKLLSFIQKTGSTTANSTLSTISTISKSYNGMKTGFLFSKN